MFNAFRDVLVSTLRFTKTFTSQACSNPRCQPQLTRNFMLKHATKTKKNFWSIMLCKTRRENKNSWARFIKQDCQVSQLGCHSMSLKTLFFGNYFGRKTFLELPKYCSKSSHWQREATRELQMFQSVCTAKNISNARSVALRRFERPAMFFSAFFVRSLLRPTFKTMH